MKKFNYVSKAIVLALLTIPYSAFAQTMKEYDDVYTTSVNREKAHTLSIPFASESAVEANKMEESPYYQSLNGVWKFRWVGDPSKRPTGFEKPTFSVVGWDDIDVPACWQVYGVRHGKSWDKPLYCNVSYPFSYDNNTYSVMADRPGWFTYNNNMKNPVGSYRRQFTIPDSWLGRDVYIRFNSMGHGGYVWVNGNFVGYSEDSYLPAEFKITDYLVEGENTLAVQVYRFTSGSFLECQDYWRLTGLMRDVFLWSAPKTQIRDYFATTTLNSTYTSATVKVEADVKGEALSNGSISVKVMDGTSVVAETSAAVTTATKKTLQLTMSNPRLWNAEEPNLYTLVVTLKDGDKVLDVRGNKLGVKQVAVRNDGALTINGKRIIVHGVDRHDFSSVNGRYVSYEETLKDILIMKTLNINAIRTSHYPDNPYFYDICDELGMYVLAEADVECHGNTGLSSVSQFKNAMVERNENHVLWMRNHPCIFMWSYGNESGGGNNFQAVENAIKALDKTRLTHYEGNSTWADVTSTMYASVGSIEGIGRDRQNQANNGQKPKPHVQCENTHAMGNSMGNQREFYNAYEKYPALVGEFIWDWKDQGLQMPVPGDASKTYWAYGGDFGDNPNDGNFCTNGVIFADYTYSAKALNVKKIYQPADFFRRDSLKGIYTIKNKMAFANLDRYAFSYEILEDGIQINKVNLDDISIAGGDSLRLTLGNLLPADAKDGAEYFIRFSAKQKEATAWAEAGYEVASEEIMLRKAINKPIYKSTATTPLTLSQNTTSYIVSGENFTISFSKTNGQLTSYKYNTKNILSGSLKFNAFRVPTDNDGSHSGEWDASGLKDLTVKRGTWTVTEEEDAIVLEITNNYMGTSPTSFTTQMSYRILSDGTVFVNSIIDPAQKDKILPKMGFIFEMPVGYENYTWYGRGPWDNYRDRKESCHIGLYHSTVTDQWTGFVLPQETGNKEDVRFISVTNNDGVGIMVVAPEHMSATVGHWRPKDMYNNRGDRKRHPYQVSFINGNCVQIDAATRGLGNNSCGPDVLDKYELKAKRMVFNFVLMPMNGTLTDAQLVEKARFASPQCAPVNIVAEKGVVTLTSSTPGSTIYYSTDGGETYKQYTTKFSFKSGGTIMAYSTSDGMAKSMTVTMEVPMYIDKTTWTVYSYDSQQGGGEAVTNAIDGNPNTIWHTNYGSTGTSHPHEIVVDMKKTYNVTAFVYQGRSDGSNGRVKEYEVYFSNNPKVWGAPDLKGTFENSGAEQVVKLTKPKAARYFRMIARSDHSNNLWTSAAEVGIQAEETTDAQTDPGTPPRTAASYFIREARSGLYLHYNVNDFDGDFCLGELDTEDKGYRFTFTQQSGFTSYYKIKNQTKYLAKGDESWRIVGGTSSQSTGTNGLFQLEAKNDGWQLRAVWMGTNEYVGVDSRNVGSYIYANKSTAALFYIESVSEVLAIDGVEMDANDDGVVYDIYGRKMPNAPLPRGIYVKGGKKILVK